jgi:hypothetical protein
MCNTHYLHYAAFSLIQLKLAAFCGQTTVLRDSHQVLNNAVKFHVKGRQLCNVEY